MTTPLGDFGPPPDAVSWSALAVAIFTLALSIHPRASDAARRIPDRVLIALLALSAAALSLGYIAIYLRGGPRIIDAAAYFLEGRTFASGEMAFHVSPPSGSFRGRFLLGSPDGRSLAPIFPPGYPAVLALGFLLGHPLLVGPAMAAALVVATYRLSLAVFEDRAVARLSAVCSACCAVLRYHTADTMSHGWSALLFAAALLAALRGTGRSLAIAGFAAGWLFATRPLSGTVAFALSGYVVLASPGADTQTRRRAALAFLSGAVLPCALFFVHQRITTGNWLRSLQQAYYAVADGPPGCFRYGFGDGVGCRVEHGEFVRARLPQGFGLLAAVGTTLRRLKMHLADAANTEVFVPLLAHALIRAPRRARPLKWGLLGIVFSYAPFYFDGNYPGGGARFFADALPLEHVLLSWALVRLRVTRWLAPIALAGFALHTSYDHRRLAAREGGRPMFESRVLDSAGVHHGLVFVDTDHGFLLGHDPLARDPRTSVVVARRRRDAHDFVLWDRLGRPETFFYAYDPRASGAVPELTRVAFDQPTVFRYEAESEWPPLSVRGGWAEPVFPACASSGRALALHPAKGLASARFEVTVPEPGGRYVVRLGWVGKPGYRVSIEGAALEQTLPGSAAGDCQVVDAGTVAMDAASSTVEISCENECLIDFMELSPVPP